jgi:hypothetical protein
MRRANSGAIGCPAGEAADAGFGAAGAEAGDCPNEKDATSANAATTSDDLKDTTNLSIYAGIVLFRLSHGDGD